MAITYVGVGAASTGNGTALTPALPASTAAGDFLVSVYAVRGNVTITTPSGWTALTGSPFSHSSVNNIKLGVAWKIAVGGDSDPAWTAGSLVAGFTTIAQCSAFRGVSGTPIGTVGSVFSGGSAQDIGPITGIALTSGQGCIAVATKMDDWTSVATLTDATFTPVEIGEPSSTLGNDAGMVWDYIIAGTSATVGNATFTVTGGAASNAIGLMFSFAPAAAGSVGTAAGTSTVAGVGRSLRAAVGSAAGTSNVAGVGRSLRRATGTAAGTSTASGVGRSTARSVGSAAGVSTVLGISVHVVSAVGTAAGTCTVHGVALVKLRGFGASTHRPLALPRPHPTYDPANEAALRKTIEDADRNNLKRNAPIEIAPGAGTLIVAEEGTGTRYQVKVVAGVLTLVAM